MNKKKFAGIFLIALSGLIALSDIIITGNVIGSSTSNYFPLITIGLFFIGLFLFFAGNREFTQTPSRGLEDLMHNIDTKQFGSVVLDSSVVIQAQNNGEDVERSLKEYKGKVYVPLGVYEELKQNPELEKIFKNRDYKEKIIVCDFEKKHPTPFKACKKTAIKYLKPTKKRDTFHTLTDYYKQPKDMSIKEWEARKDELKSEFRVDIERVEQKARRTKRIAGRGYRSPTNAEKYETLRRSYGVTKEDIEVLATGILLSSLPAGIHSSNQNSAILSDDGHIIEATKELQKNLPRFKDHLGCYNFRGEVA